MEVWVLEKYYPEGNMDIINVFDNPEAAMYSIKLLHADIVWTKYTSYCVGSNVDDEIYYYLTKFQVILDEVPN